MQFWRIVLDLLGGFSSSVFLFIFTLLFALPLGLVFAFGLLSKIKPIKYVTDVIVMVIRGTPLMLQIFVIFYVPGLLFGFVWPSLNTGLTYLDQTFSTRFIACLVAFIINYAAYFAEIYRGGIISIPKGQYEAASVLGLSKKETFYKVILLQMIKRIIPPLGNEVITLIKDTSLANVIAVSELMFVAQRKLNQGLVWPIFFAGAFYFVFNTLTNFILKRVEKKLEYIKI